MNCGKKILLTWIGLTDLKAADGSGPVATLLEGGPFGLIHYLYTPDHGDQAEILMKRLGQRYRAETRGHPADICPIDHKAIFDQAASILRALIKKGQVAVNVTSGTPAMASVMLYLGRTMGLEVLSTVEPKYAQGPGDSRVRVVDWDFGLELRRAMADPSDGPSRAEGDLINLKKDDLINLKMFASQDCGILIGGETGVGKTLLARRIHHWSGRRGRFVERNCAEYSGLELNLAKSDLLGHVRGAFTGADRNHDGAFLEADGGTLFLDEVGELAPALQSFLLKTIAEQSIRRLGENKARQVNVKIIAATNRDLMREVRADRFRADLYYRLSDYPVTLSPLRELRLAVREKFVADLAEEVVRERKLPRRGLTRAALKLMAAHSWPGNIRQLKQSLARLLLSCVGPEVTEERVRVELDRPSPEAPAPGGTPALEEDRPLDEAVAIFRYRRVQAALERHEGKKAEAAAGLGISPQTLNNYLREGRRRLAPGEA